MKSSSIKRKVGRLTFSACALLCAGGLFMSCEDSLLTGTPSWLGSSIYDELAKRGEYSTTLRLIDDPVINQSEVLKLTGSKTLFVANDQAYERFFANNKWGVKKYEDLSDAQKLTLFNNSMVNSAYLIELLSSISASGNDEPRQGLCMRRATAMSVYDSVPNLLVSTLPKNEYWDDLREEYGEDGHVLIMRDNTSSPMVHFLPAFMSNNQLTNEDISFLTNGKCTSTDQAYINSQPVVEQDITCQNGYIHVLGEVMEPMTNMAECIRNNPDFTMMSSFLDRFAVPVLSEGNTTEYNRIWGLTGDNQKKVYNWRYLNYGFDKTRTSGGNNSLNEAGGTVLDYADLLPYDPGWNSYASAGINKSMAEDMAVMIVPTDKAIEEYGQSGAGQILLDNFGTWENVPDHIIVMLLQNLMKESLVSTVPSKFSTVVNTAQQSMNMKVSDIDSCLMCNNGMIYKANVVYSAPDYQSVSFPTALEDNMKVMRWAINQLEYDAYLNSMDSKYTFVIPTDTALSYYVDPVDYHKNRPTISQFYYVDYDATVKGPTVKCRRWYMNADGTKGDEIRTWSGITETDYIKNRLNDILNNSIVIGYVAGSDPTPRYYSTKGGSPIEFRLNGDNTQIAGPFQIEQGNTLSLRSENNMQGSYDMTTGNQGGNGISYIISKQSGNVSAQPLMPASKSVPTILREMSQKDSEGFSEFYEILKHSNLLSLYYDVTTSTGGQSTIKSISNDTTINVMNNYNYTVYVPKSSEIRNLYSMNVIPDWRTFDILEEQWRQEGLLEDEIEAKLDSMQNILDNFIRYHIQNNAVYLGGDNEEVSYETTLRDGGRFTSVYVSNKNGVMTVRPNDLNGNPQVITDSKGEQHTSTASTVTSSTNYLAREYHFRSNSGASVTTIEYANTIYNSSFAVVHPIDKPLLYGDLAKKYYESQGN